MTSEKKPPQGIFGNPVSFDLESAYAIDGTKVVTDVDQIHYSNLAMVNVTHRDVFIDFLQLPGVKRDDMTHLPGVRVFMSYASAQRLADAISDILVKVYSEGGMEEYHLDETKKKR